MKNKDRQYKRELARILAKTTNPRAMGALLEDLLTPSEYSDIAKRLQIVRHLEKGIPQREIAKKLGISIAKVTRGSRAIYDSRGGFTKALAMFG